MPITYQNEKNFTPAELEELFRSVNWSSGHYPEKLVTAMANSSTVYTARDSGKLVGLVNTLDDGAMTAYIHFLLVNPNYQNQKIGFKLVELVKEQYKDYLRIVLVAYNDELPFYKKCGFTPSVHSTPVFITSLWT